MLLEACVLPERLSCSGDGHCAATPTAPGCERVDFPHLASSSCLRQVACWLLGYVPVSSWHTLGTWMVWDFQRTALGSEPAFPFEASQKQTELAGQTVHLCTL